MQKKIITLILLLMLTPAFCLFSQNYSIDFTLKPDEPVEGELETGTIRILFKLTYQREANQLSVEIQNNDLEKTLWLFGRNTPYKTFAKKNKAIWCYKGFKLENPEFQSYVKEYYNPLPHHVIYVMPQKSVDLIWKNIDDDFSGQINTLIFYTSVYDKKGRSEKKKTTRFERKLSIKLRVDLDLEEPNPCGSADLSSYESFLNRKSYELYKIVEEIPLRGDTIVLKEAYTKRIVQLVNEVKQRQRKEPCINESVGKALDDIELGVQHGFSRIKSIEASLPPVQCASPIKEINKLTSQVEGLYIKIRIANAEETDITPYRNEFLSIKNRVEEIRSEKPACKAQMQDALNKFNVASDDVASQLK